MKIEISICLIMSFIVLSCNQPKKNAIEGSWKVVAIQRIAQDTVAFQFPGDYSGSNIKVWTKGNFLFVGQFKRDTTILNSYGGGTYKLNNKLYEENIQYHTYPSSVGKNVKMTIEIRNDTLIQTWPADENGRIDKGNYYQEKYVRLD